MSGCVGNGVVIPLLGFVGVGVGGLASSPIMLTQAYASAQRPPQEDPALGFQARNLASVIPCLEAMSPHWSPETTK